MSDSSTAKSVLRSLVERIERLDEEIKGLNNDKRDIYSEARGNGFDVKALKQVIRLRAQDPAERQETDAIVNTYLTALGMRADQSDDVTTPFSEPSGPLEEALSSQGI